MNILIVMDHCIEEVTTFAAALVELEHEVTVIPRIDHDNFDLSHLKDALPDTLGSFDLVFAFDLTGISNDLHCSIGESLACPQINILLGHPAGVLSNIIDVERLNAFMMKNKIYFWNMCKEAMRDIEFLRLENTFFSPWGYHPKFLLCHSAGFYHKKHRLDTRHTMLMSKAAWVGRSKNPKYRETYDLVYLGQPDSTGDDADLSPHPKHPQLAEKAKQIAMICSNDYSITRRTASKQHSPDLPIVPQDGSTSDQLKLFLFFHQRFCLELAKLNRQKVVSSLKQEFGDRFILYGSKWAEIGLNSHPDNSQNRTLLYHNTPISLDCGSLSFETCLYPRSLEIMSYGGVLVQKKCFDTDEFQVPNQSCITYISPDELSTTLHTHLSSPDSLEKVRMTAASHAQTHLGFTKTLPVLLEKLVNATAS